MKRGILSSVYLKNGNILFSYRPYNFKDIWIYASFPFFLVFAIMIIEWLSLKTCFSVVLFIFSIPVFFMQWLKIRDRRNKKIEESVVNNCLQPIIETDIKRIGDGVLELERVYEIIPVDDSTIYGKRRLVVALNNGNQLIYKVENPKMLSNILLLEINVKVIIE